MKTLTALALLLIMPLAALRAAELSKPNIILVMPDDAGYGDYACLGNPIMRTPVVDALEETEPALHTVSCESDLFALPLGADERAA